MNGFQSLNRDGSVGFNTPTNYAGVSGTVNVANVPAMPAGWLVALVVAALAGGILVLRR